MSRKKNLLDYLALTLFIMCMGLALSASLEYVTRATEREYLCLLYTSDAADE